MGELSGLVCEFPVNSVRREIGIAGKKLFFILRKIFMSPSGKNILRGTGRDEVTVSKFVTDVLVLCDTACWFCHYVPTTNYKKKQVALSFRVFSTFFKGKAVPIFCHVPAMH